MKRLSGKTITVAKAVEATAMLAAPGDEDVDDVDGERPPMMLL